MRRFSDPVQVRVKDAARERSRVQVQVQGQAREGVREQPPVRLPDDDRPEAFIWRGRLYVVRDVVGHWRERRAWWRDALDTEESAVRPGETLAAAASEQHVWRVEASPGWSFAPGVYDLAHDVGTRGEQWALVRVAD